MSKIYYTTCPQCYDYAYTTEIDAHFGKTKRGEIVRAVSTPDDMEEYQIGRYWSGGIYVIIPSSELKDFVEMDLIVCDELHTNNTLFDLLEVTPEEALFQPGRLVMTPGAEKVLLESDQTPFEFMNRHLLGDWGDLCPEDIEENELSLKEGYRILSAYHTLSTEKIWVITERDRSVTTILLPSEY
jgi:hypothetical protein